MTKLNRWRPTRLRSHRRLRRSPFAGAELLSQYFSIAPLAIEHLESRRLLASDELVYIRLETTDLAGTPLPHIVVGDQFQLRAYVEDPNATVDVGSVFSAFFDVKFDPLLAAVQGAISYGPNYQNDKSGDTSTPGLMDDIGATAGGGHLGPGEFRLFTVTLTANAPGELDFLSEESHNLPARRILLLDGDITGVPPEDVLYGGASILVFQRPTISVSDEVGIEGSAILFHVELSDSSPETVSVEVVTEGITAVAGSDYTTPATDILTFVPGNKSRTVLVPLLNDSIDEAIETFRLRLFNATNATILDDEGIGSIEDTNDPPTVSIEGISVLEGNGGTVQAVFNVRLSDASGQTITVDYTTGNVTATAGSDYTSKTGTVTFQPGDLLQTITVLVTGDTASESFETFTVDLLNPVNVVIDVGQAIGEIRDDDAIGISIDHAQLIEGDAGTANMSFTVRLTRASNAPVTVTATASPITATENVDYQATSQQITFQPGETEKTFLVPVVGDFRRESNETLAATLTAPSGGILLESGAIGTIIDNDPIPTITINDNSIYDNVTGTVNLVFTVTLSNPTDFPVTVEFSTLGDTAESDVDFTAASGTVTFAPGETQQTVAISIIGDTDDEPDEQFFVDLSNPTNATIGDSRGIGTLLEIPPLISIGDVSVVEGDLGTVDLVFTISLSEEVDDEVTVDFATVAGTAAAGVDYESLSGTVTFAPHQLTQTVTIKVLGDLSDEFNETFFVHLSNPVGAILSAAEGQGTIIDNDDIPLIAVEQVTKAEGNSGTTSFQFLVSLSVASGKTVSVNFATSDLTATAGEDYTALDTLLTFAPGVASQLVTVEVIGDNIFEQDETFLVTLSEPTNAGLEDPDDTATGTIQNDESRPTVSIDDATIDEGDLALKPLQFTVRLSHPSSETITVAFATSAVTATADGDYQSASGVLTFEPGVTEMPIVVQIVGDTTDEPHETFLVTLSAPTNATIADGEATGTITDDDGPTTVSITDAQIVEGNAGTKDLVFTLTLSRSTEQTVTVQFSTANGTAKAALDYLAAAGTVTFLPTETTQTLVVPIVGDLLDEEDETFFVNLFAPVNAEIIDGTASGTIQDDDDAPTVSIEDAITSEGDSNTRPLQFKLTLSAPSGRTISVNYATLAGTAAVGGDFDAAGGTVTFAPGEVEKFLSVPIIGDVLDEDDENFFVDLSNPVNAGIADGRGVGDILDDDRSPTLAITNALVTEVDTAPQSMWFVVLLSGPSARTVTVEFATADNTATLADNDYLAKSGVLTFLPGETQKVIEVVVLGDDKEEPDETLFVRLSNPVNATFDMLLLSSPQGTGFILSDDLPFVVGSLGGYTYVDANDNGIREADENLLTGVRIVLSGTNILGETVSDTRWTDATDGSYLFANLVPGTYTISQPDQPPKYVDGKDTPGSLGIVGLPQNEYFVVALPSNQHGTDYNFGEYRLQTPYISRVLYQASTPDPHPIAEINPSPFFETNPPIPIGTSIARLAFPPSPTSQSSAIDRAFAEIGTLAGSPGEELLRLMGIGMVKQPKDRDNSLFDPFGDVELD